MKPNRLRRRKQLINVCGDRVWGMFIEAKLTISGARAALDVSIRSVLSSKEVADSFVYFTRVAPQR